MLNNRIGQTEASLKTQKQTRMKNSLSCFLVCTQMGVYFTQNWPKDRLYERKNKKPYFARHIPITKRPDFLYFWQSFALMAHSWARFIEHE